MRQQSTGSTTSPLGQLDYSLTGVNSTLALERGLAEADWYQCPIPRDQMRRLLERCDGPALWNTLLWFTLILGSGVGTYALWGTWWAVVPYALYSVLYASTSDSRWHESGHGTAFQTDWMNKGLYEIASFMVMRESVPWRWSHTRHHSDTIIVGRDPEIAAPRPVNLRKIAMAFFNLGVYPKYFQHIWLHSCGKMTTEEKTYIPDEEFAKVYTRARVYVAIYVCILALALVKYSLLPLLLVGLTNLFGTWLMVIYGLTQHAGLAENVLDHRLNCRTVYMSPMNRFLYWNMNYHVEHHMFPLVPFHALPRLHQLVKNDCPAPYPSLLSAWREIVPALLKQGRDPTYHIKRRLPKPARQTVVESRPQLVQPDAEGWILVCESAALLQSDVIRFDHGKKTFAIYRDNTDHLYATDGLCTHGNVHLSGGLVVGRQIECPKHNGRFHLVDGSPARVPVCRGLATYPIEKRGEHLYLNISRAGGTGARVAKTFTFRVVSNRNIATFIKELVLELRDENERLSFIPGDYLQIDIPAYDTIRFSDFDIPEPYASVWRNQHLFDLISHNHEKSQRNNYSLASNQKTEAYLRFNIRIAMPPPGQECSPGVGSSYVFNLKPGDTVTGIGPFGDFHIKSTQREMMYIGGGAGMAPLRAHLSHLLETERTSRKVSFWYGARSRQEIFYESYFRDLAAAHSNFSFHLALSSPLDEDQWEGYSGFIHDVVRERYLRDHARPETIEYYLCGPPIMVKACTKSLSALGIPASQIAFDEF